MPIVAEMKDAFVCYRSYIEAIQLLPEDKRWSFFEKIINYALDGTEPCFAESDAKLAFTLMKANIDSCNKRYTASVENGKKGGNPNFQKGAPNPYRNKLCKPCDNPKDNVNVNDTLSNVSEEGAETAPPPPLKRYQIKGDWYEEYVAGDGEKRVRKIE